MTVSFRYLLVLPLLLIASSAYAKEYCFPFNNGNKLCVTDGNQFYFQMSNGSGYVVSPKQKITLVTATPGRDTPQFVEEVLEMDPDARTAVVSSLGSKGDGHTWVVNSEGRISQLPIPSSEFMGLNQQLDQQLEVGRQIKGLTYSALAQPFETLHVEVLGKKKMLENRQFLVEVSTGKFTEFSGSPSVGEFAPLVDKISDAGISVHKFTDRSGLVAVLEKGKKAGTGAATGQPRKALEAIDTDDAEFKSFFDGNRRILNDEVTKLPKVAPFVGREEQVDRVIDILARTKSKSPLLLGEPGVGKSTIASQVAERIVQNKLPKAARFQRSLKDAVVVEASLSKINLIGQTPELSLNDYLQSYRKVEAALGVPMVLVIDDIDLLEGGQAQILAEALADHPPLNLISSTTNRRFGLLRQYGGALTNQLEPISVPELSHSAAVKMIEETHVPQLSNTYGGAQGPARIPTEVVEAVVERSAEIYPDRALPDRAIRLLEDTLIEAHRKAGEKTPHLNVAAVSETIKRRVSFPLDPSQPAAYQAELSRIRKELSSKLVDQEHYADAMVKAWGELYRGKTPKTSRRVLLISGTTGSGKTFGGETFAEIALGGQERLLSIDATKYRTDGDFTKLFGAGPGYIGSDKTIGVLPEFLSGRGKGANVILINELDKATPLFMNSIMEMLDTGILQANDGNDYRLGKSLVIFTTNKGSDKAFPQGFGQALSREETRNRLKSIKSADVKKWFMEPDARDAYDTSNSLSAAAMARVDEALVAVPPTREGAVEILKNEFADFARSQNAKIHVDNSFFEHLAREVYVPEDGIREPKRAVQTVVNETVSAAENKLGLDLKKSELKLTLELGSDGHPNVLRLAPLSKAVTKKSVTFEAPERTARSANPFTDPVLRRRVGSLELSIKKQVYGQDEAVAKTVRAIVNRITNPQSVRPVAQGYFGTTGTGKTELAKATADALYGSRDRIKSFNMGEIHSRAQLQNIFGSPVGYLGSNRQSALAQHLTNFPEGSVIVFDEVGNMGSGNPELKNAMLKSFYGMLDEGKWTDAHGKTYDLSKHVIIFTGNEGKEVFSNLPSDDLRIAAWRAANTREGMFELLKKHGWPEELLGRLQSNITLFKPLIAPERLAIAKKFVDSSIQDIRKSHPLKGVKIDPKFYETVAEAFFSHSEGARKIRGLVEGDITNLLGQALIHGYNQADPDFLKNSTLELHVADNYEGLRTYTGVTPPRREVKLKVVLQHPTKGSLVFEEDIAASAVSRTLKSPASMRRTAYHEAGHLVANAPSLTGEVAEMVTIEGMGSYGGYARFVPIQQTESMTRSNAVAHLGRILAGAEAEKLAGLSASSGWSSDWNAARDLASRFVGQYGLVDSPLHLPMVDGKINLNSPAVSAEVTRLLEDGEIYARSRLIENWPKVELATSRLQKHGQLSTHDLARLDTDAKSREYLARYRAEKIQRPKPLPAAATQELFRGCPDLQHAIRELLFPEGL